MRYQSFSMVDAVLRCCRVFPSAMLPGGGRRVFFVGLVLVLLLRPFCCLNSLFRAALAGSNAQPRQTVAVRECKQPSRANAYAAKRRAPYQCCVDGTT